LSVNNIESIHSSFGFVQFATAAAAAAAAFIYGINGLGTPKSKHARQQQRFGAAVVRSSTGVWIMSTIMAMTKCLCHGAFYRNQLK
jgi:hypothetical protein